MNKAIAKFTTFFFTAAVALVSAGEPYAEYQAEVGYRCDDLKLKSHSVLPTGATFESTDKFKDLDIVTIGLEIKALIPCWVYGRGNLQYGWICGEHTRGEFSVSSPIAGEVDAPILGNSTATNRHRVRGEYVCDMSGAFGYPFEFLCSRLMVAPLIGYSYDEQKIHLRSFQEITMPSSNPDFDTGVLPQVATFNKVFRSVRASWWGPWIGADIDYLVACGWKVYGEFEYHFGTTKLHTRTHYDNSTFGVGSSTHTGRKKAHGVNIRLGTNYIFWCDWLIGLHIDYKNWRSTQGSKTHLDWTSYSIGVDLGYAF